MPDQTTSLQPLSLTSWPLPDETIPAELLDYLAAMWSNRVISVATEWCYLPGRYDSGVMADVERLAKGRLYQQLAEFGFTTLVTPRVMWTRCPEDVVPTDSREPREVDWAPGDLVQIGDRLVCRVSAFSIPLMHPMVVQ